MSIEILKVRLHETKKGNGLILHINRSNGGDEVVGVETHKAIIHRDLKKAIDGLAIHLAVLAEYVNPIDIQDISRPGNIYTEKFFVKGYSVGGDEAEGTRGVIISGRKILRNGMAHNYNTTFNRFEQAPESRYTFMDDLIARLTDIETEIMSYLDGSKRGDPVQQEIPGLEEKVSEEAKFASKEDQFKYAGKAQMAGMNGKPKKGKKVVQSAENPSGESE